MITQEIARSIYRDYHAPVVITRHGVDYTELRARWVYLLADMQKDGLITEKQATTWTLPKSMRVKTDTVKLTLKF